MTSTVMLTGITWDHARGYDCLAAASRTYADNTGVDVRWTRRSLQAFADQPIGSLAEQYDLIILDHPHVGQIATSGCLLPLPAPEPGVTASIGGSAESYVWNGETWAYAVDAACQMAVRRPDLDGPRPSLWEDFLDADAYRFRAVTPLLPVDAFDTFLTLVASQRGARVPASRDAFVAGDRGRIALQVLKALYRLGPAEAVDWNPIFVLELLSTTDEFACSPCLFGYINYAGPGFRPHTLAYADLPVFGGVGKRRGILGGAGLGVSARTGHADAAVAFARWVASEPVQSGAYLEGGGQPAHRGTWNAMADNPRYQGFFKGAFETMQSAWTRPRDPWFPGFVDDVCEMFPGFFRQDRDPDAFLADLNTVYRHHTGRHSGIRHHLERS